MPVFSIIVPIYNVEKYLRQCIDSVLNQSFHDIELILVNDGSPDNSGEICDEYAKENSCIKVIHKINGGLSDARNAGIAVAKGEFIWFLDSDDYMQSNSLENVWELIKKNSGVDIVTCAHVNLYSDGVEQIARLPIKYSGEFVNRDDFQKKLFKSEGSYWAAWKNIYRNSIVQKNKLFFSKGLIGAEDCDFFMNYIRHAEKFLFLNIPVIYYRINREGSITNVMSKKAVIGQLEVFQENFNVYNQKNNIYSPNMKCFFANKFANTISLLPYLKTKSDILDTVLYIQKHKLILKKTKGAKYTIAKISWKVFGFYKGSILLGKINRK